MQSDPVIQDGFCPDEFYNIQSDLLDTFTGANIALENDDWLRDTNRIIYIGTTSQSPQTITNFMHGEVIRFVDDLTQSDCLRGSKA